MSKTIGHVSKVSFAYIAWIFNKSSICMLNKYLKLEDIWNSSWKNNAEILFVLYVVKFDCKNQSFRRLICSIRLAWTLCSAPGIPSRIYLFVFNRASPTCPISAPPLCFPLFFHAPNLLLLLSVAVHCSRRS